jgi:hypothetical protein
VLAMVTRQAERERSARWVATTWQGLVSAARHDPTCNKMFCTYRHVAQHNVVNTQSYKMCL